MRHQEFVHAQQLLSLVGHEAEMLVHSPLAGLGFLIGIKLIGVDVFYVVGAYFVRGCHSMLSSSITLSIAAPTESVS